MIVFPRVGRQGSRAFHWRRYSSDRCGSDASVSIKSEGILLATRRSSSKSQSNASANFRRSSSLWDITASFDLRDVRSADADLLCQSTLSHSSIQSFAFDSLAYWLHATHSTDYRLPCVFAQLLKFPRRAQCAYMFIVDRPARRSAPEPDQVEVGQ